MFAETRCRKNHLAQRGAKILPDDGFVHSAYVHPKQFSMPWTFFLGEHLRHPRSNTVTHHAAMMRTIEIFKKISINQAMSYD